MPASLMLLLILSCGTDASPALQAPTEAPPPSEVPAHMGEHLDRITEARDALVRGDVLATKPPLRWLAEHEPPAGLPDDSRVQVERLRAAARSAQQTNKPEAIGRGIAAVANACGECHTANGVRATFEPVLAPTEDAGVKAQMLRHAWANDQMWHALIGPEPGGWAAAAELLGSHPFPESPEADLMSPEVRMIATEQYVAGLGTLTAGSGTERLERYGDFLAGCASCHLHTSGGPEK